MSQNSIVKLKDFSLTKQQTLVQPHQLGFSQIQLRVTMEDLVRQEKTIPVNLNCLLFCACVNLRISNAITKHVKRKYYSVQHLIPNVKNFAWQGLESKNQSPFSQCFSLIGQTLRSEAFLLQQCFNCQGNVLMITSCKKSCLLQQAIGKKFENVSSNAMAP